MPPQVILGDRLPPQLVEMLGAGYEIVLWPENFENSQLEQRTGIITYAHPVYNDGRIPPNKLAAFRNRRR